MRVVYQIGKSESNPPKDVEVNAKKPRKRGFFVCFFEGWPVIGPDLALRGSFFVR